MEPCSQCTFLPSPALNNEVEEEKEQENIIAKLREQDIFHEESDEAIRQYCKDVNRLTPTQRQCVIDKFVAIHAIPFEQHKLTLCELLHILTFGQRVLDDYKTAGAFHLKKGVLYNRYFSQDDQPIARSLIIDPQTQHIHILSKDRKENKPTQQPKPTILHKTGSLKKVTSTISVDNNGGACIGAQSVNRDGKTISGRSTAIQRHFAGTRGIVGLQSYTTYIKNNGAEKQTFIQELYSSDLKEACITSPKDILKVASDIATGIAALHAAGYAHMDLKLENILIRHNGGTIEAGIADFDTTYNPNNEQPPEALLMPELYGTLASISPEAILDGSMNQQAKDMYAIGLILSWLLRKEFLPSEEEFAKGINIEKFCTAAQRVAEEYALSDKQKTRLINCTCRSDTPLEEKLRAVTRLLLIPDPNMRLTAQEFLDCMTCIERQNSCTSGSVQE